MSDSQILELCNFSFYTLSIDIRDTAYQKGFQVDLKKNKGLSIRHRLTECKVQLFPLETKDESVKWKNLVVMVV